MVRTRITVFFALGLDGEWIGTAGNGGAAMA